MSSNVPAADKGVLGIRTLADVRAFVHVGAPVLAAVLVGTGYVDNSIAQLVLTFVLALVSPTLALLNSTDKIRSVLYSVVALASGLAILLGYTTEADWAQFVPIFSLLIGGGVASSNTNTSKDSVTA